MVIRAERLFFLIQTKCADLSAHLHGSRKVCRSFLRIWEKCADLVVDGIPQLMYTENDHKRWRKKEVFKIKTMEWKTTFAMDFTIADAFGIKAVKDTFKRAFKEWKDNYIYLTELEIVMNLKCWDHYYAGHTELSELYADYYYKCREYAYKTFTDDQLHYHFEMTD